MKTILAIATLTLVGVTGLFAVPAVQSGVWTQDLEAAKVVAKEKGLPLLLNFTGSDWCGWCKLMDKNVFGKPEWETYAADKLMLVTLDFPRDKSLVPEAYVARNNELKKQFGVRGYPTYVLVDSDGETEIGRLGAGRDKTAASFAAEIEQVLQFTDASIAAFMQTLDTEDKAAYQEMLEAIRRSEQEIETTMAAMMEAREKLQSLHDSITDLTAQATAFRAEKTAAGK